ncbi:MAG TPA: aldo/keto reductase [Solirubrobacteraceae bacterium]|jgi:aryl-alcohol dehydrogenase-like predicted oxidoreductase|nr:aldo/keto reductase [Solirubrobacteraceae bacterium]
MRTPSHTAIGTWSGGRYLHFGEAIGETRLEALLEPGGGLDTLLTADAYGAGEADRLLGRALRGSDRDAVCIVGAIGHDFYEGEREGAKGYPRFTDARLRGPEAYADYVRMATERSLERLGIDAFDLLLLHNPDRTGYTSEVVWQAMRAVRDEGLTGRLGIAPGPANGFTLDIIDCLERFGELIDWAMVILNPLEPWPAELCLAAAREHDVDVMTRVVDYGGLFWDDVRPGHTFAPRDHRTFRPDGWVDAGAGKLEQLRPIAERHGLTMLQLAAQWCLAHEPVACVIPTLIQEIGAGARPIEEKRAELLATPRDVVLDDAEVAAIRVIGDNSGSMSLKGADPEHDGEPRPDRWQISPELDAVARRWGIEPERDLRHLSAARG